MTSPIRAELGNAPAHMQGLIDALYHYGSVAAFRAAMPMPDQAQRLIDTVTVKVGRDRLTAVAEFLNAGLTYSLQNWISVPHLYWEQEADTGSARRTMELDVRGETSMPDRAGKYLPIYATMADFNFGQRALAASERAGAPLDTASLEQNIRRVNESIEDAFINGATDVISGGYQAYGLLNAPNAATYIYESGMAWDNAAKTGQKILDDVTTAIGKLVANKKFGPYTLLVPTLYGIKMANNFGDGVTTQPITILERLQKVDVGGGRPLKIVVCDRLPANYTVLVQMTSDIAQVVVGQQPVTVNWSPPPGFRRYYAVLSCIVPRVRDDKNSKSGICIGYTS